MNSISYGLLIALAIALVFAAFTDMKRRQIDNWLNAAIALGAPVFWWASGLSLWPDVAIQLGVALAAFAVFAGMFALRMMGGGDVKLLTVLALYFYGGDSLQGMAGKDGKQDWQGIAAANGIEDPLRMSPGQLVNLEAGVGVSAGV